jgi:hypothetical protein
MIKKKHVLSQNTIESFFRKALGEEPVYQTLVVKPPETTAIEAIRG